MVQDGTVAQSQKLWKTLGLALIGYALVVYLAALLPWGPRIGNECLPEWLQGKRHDDYYLRWTRWLPRAATSWCIQSAPLLLLGNQKSRAQALDGTTDQSPSRLRESGSSRSFHSTKAGPFSSHTLPGRLKMAPTCAWELAGMTWTTTIPSPASPLRSQGKRDHRAGAFGLFQTSDHSGSADGIFPEPELLIRYGHPKAAIRRG